MKTIEKSIMSLGLSLLVGGAAFAQTAGQDQDKDKDKKIHQYQDTRTSQMQGQDQQDFTSYDSNSDGQLDEDEFVVVYTEVYTLQDTTKNQGQNETADRYQGQSSDMKNESETSEISTDETQQREMISAQFETVDEDSDGYIDEQEFKSWKRDSGAK